MRHLRLIVYFAVMIKNGCLIFLLTLASSCYLPERKCEDFKTGTFKFDYTIDGVEKTGTFTRDDKYSVEFYDNKVDSATVRWINNCEFVLKSLHNQNSIHFKILETTSNSYTFEFQNAVKSSNKKQTVLKGTATKTN